tara:strand:- start:1114 stop:1854 length:741 start_codon:yes stop_codon:yes gene_type:complete
MKSISPILNVMIKASEKASKILIRDFGEVENLQVSQKGPLDFVTNADQKAEKILINELNKSRNKFSIISEESGYIENTDKKNTWVIDPIDGTTNFLHGIPHFCISLALLSYSEIVSGLIFDPIKNEIFYAEKNNGAYFNNQRIRVSKKKNLSECLFATNKNGAQYKDINVRISGSAALDLAYVSSGRLDGYYQKDVNLWDIAAGLLLVKEAGGKTNFIDFQKTSNHKLLASSNNIHDKMIEKLDKF